MRSVSLQDSQNMIDNSFVYCIVLNLFIYSPVSMLVFFFIMVDSSSIPNWVWLNYLFWKAEFRRIKATIWQNEKEFISLYEWKISKKSWFVRSCFRSVQRYPYFQRLWLEYARKWTILHRYSYWTNVSVYIVFFSIFLYFILLIK